MSSNKKQYTITHKCDYEGESFSFVVYLTANEYGIIKDVIDKIKDKNIEDEFYLEETSLSVKDIDLINKYSTNTYMNRIGWYGVDFNNLHVEGNNIPFYKGRSLYPLYTVVDKGASKKTYVTEIHAIDPETGELKVYAGPTIQAVDRDEAKDYCQNNGLGYCKVLGISHEIDK